MSPRQVLGLLTFALTFATHEATAANCYAGCNFRIRSSEDSAVPRALDNQKRPVQPGCLQVPRFASNSTSLLVPVPYQRGAWNRSSFAALHILEGDRERIIPLQGRPWLSSVINAQTLGYFATGWDTDNDRYEVATYRLYNVYTGRSETVHLPCGTHDAHYNRQTNTIFYLKVENRTLQHPCPIPWDSDPDPLRTKKYLVETVVEVDLEGKPLWSMPVEQAVCHRPLVQYDNSYGGFGSSTFNESNTKELFHMNYVVYLHHRDELIVTSKFQGTAYVISKSSRKLRWAVGAHGTIPLAWLAIHCFMPLGRDRYAVYHNNVAKGQASAVVVVHVDHGKRQATIVRRVQGNPRLLVRNSMPTPFARVAGAGIGIGAKEDHLLGGTFSGRDLYLRRFIADGQITQAADCQFGEGAWIYGMTFVYRDFGLALTFGRASGPSRTLPAVHVSYHAAHWDSEPITASLVLWKCSDVDEPGHSAHSTDPDDVPLVGRVQRGGAGM